MKIEKQLQNQKLYYDAYIVQMVRNLIHLFEVPKAILTANKRRSSRECEEETDHWENVLPSLDGTGPAN